MEKWVYFEKEPLKNHQGYVIARCEDEFIEGKNLRFKEIGEKSIFVSLTINLSANVQLNYMMPFEEFVTCFVSIVDSEEK